ncbi:protein of unknown function (plasmid) [Cupriavidus taiwanensis]|uniref:Uncharacterized protein n=1 Tax=Cupriavidus taiwanensis TaxID=164546 RepID=A0A375IST5_9BURK|nr:protein of unknown function [Cupriavidus taiwanensis]
MDWPWGETKCEHSFCQCHCRPWGRAAVAASGKHLYDYTTIAKRYQLCASNTATWPPNQWWVRFTRWCPWSVGAANH